MNDSNNHNFELPKPPKGVEIYSPINNEQDQKNEQQSANNEQEPSAPEPTVTVLGAPVQLANTSQPSAVQSQSISVSSSSMVADDLDVMEKEWVNRAKQVVDATRDNPRQQNIELAKVKADYLQKRYQKNLKVDEDKN